MEEIEYISTKEAAKISDYAQDYIRELLRTGRINGKMIFGSIWQVDKASLLKHMEEQGRSVSNLT